MIIRENSQKKMKMYVAVLVGVVLLFAGAKSLDAANLIVNGSFETRDFTGWGTKDIEEPFLSMGVVPAGITPGYDLFMTAPTDGIFVAHHGFDGAGPGTIEIFQDVVIPAGASATLTFDWRAGWDLTLTGTATAARLLDVVIEPFGGGSALATTNILTALPLTFVPDTEPASESLDLNAFLGSSVRINFMSTIPEYYTGPAHLQLDNVVLDHTIPEPGTVCLLGLGGLILRRRKRTC